MPEPFRIAPKMPPSAYKTYALRMPLITHYRKARCEEVDCQANANGWVTKIEVTGVLGQKQAKYIREHCGRVITSIVQSGDLITFTFPSGQQCFADHRVPLEREPFYIVQGGDWRGNPRGERRVHARAADWVEDFAEHQAGIIAEIEKG